MKYLIVDYSNLMHRCKHASSGDSWESIGFMLHLVLSSIKSIHRKYNIDHTVVCTEGRSWRKDAYKPYKANRTHDRDEMFDKAYADLLALLHQTNVTILHHDRCEADDLIAGWVQTHENDHHYILSGDSDFRQLIANNVTLCDGVAGKIYTIAGVYDEKGKPCLDKKTKQPIVVNPDYYLFLKIIRGDSGDNVFSAYPNVRETKIQKVFTESHAHGYEWSNFMAQTWTDVDGNINTVGDCFERNRMLIDLTAQPDDVKLCIAECIAYSAKHQIPTMEINFKVQHFLKQYELETLAKYPRDLVTIFSQPSNEPVIEPE